jgi:hypothetical protein
VQVSLRRCTHSFAVPAVLCSDGAVGMLGFFIVFFIHVGFCTWAAIGVRQLPCWQMHGTKQQVGSSVQHEDYYDRCCESGWPGRSHTACCLAAPSGSWELETAHMHFMQRACGCAVLRCCVCCSSSACRRALELHRLCCCSEGL